MKPSNLPSGSRCEGNEQGQSHTQKRVPDTNSSRARAAAARRDECARGHTPSVEGEDPVTVARSVFPTTTLMLNPKER